MGRAAAGSGRIVKLLDYANGRELDTLRLPDGTASITALAFTPTDTNVLATVSGQTVHFWNLAAKRVTSTLTLSNPGLKGNTWGAAVINQPQVAILRMGSIVKRPVVASIDGADTIRIAFSRVAPEGYGIFMRSRTKEGTTWTETRITSGRSLRRRRSCRHRSSTPRNSTIPTRIHRRCCRQSSRAPPSG